MPFDNEFATGESLLSYRDSEALRSFRARIVDRPVGRSPPQVLDVQRDGWIPRRVIAVDGSTVTEAVRNGFPVAEATLLKVSVVSIDLTKLRTLQPQTIPSPRIFYEMERAETFDAVLPGANIVRRDVPNDSPRSFFRDTVFQTFDAHLDQSHETLLETVREIVRGRHSVERVACPIEGCEERLTSGTGAYACACEKAAMLFETDSLRFSERFSDIASNGEAHGEVRHVLEVVALLNILRFFSDERRPSGFEYLRECVFVLDGPLALFGHPAWLTPYIREELERINRACKAATGSDIAIFGYEKSGEFVNHFEQIDFSDQLGPRGLLPAGTVIAPDAAYVNRNIALRPSDAKPHGADTYFGRKVLYKTRSGEHAVITSAMINEASRDFRRNDHECYPRLGNILNVLDYLSTYLYRDGFMPLVRAHAHAAIPLRRGSDIIRGLFDESASGNTSGGSD